MNRTRRRSGRTRIITGLSFAATLTMALAYGQVLRAPDAHAATISCSVTDPGDTAGDSTNRTLRYCIGQTNANADGGTITFSGVTTVTLDTALPQVSRTLTIDGGSGNAVQIRRTTAGTPTFGFLDVADTATSLELRKLDIRGFTGMASSAGIIRTETNSSTTLVSIVDTTIAANGGSGRLIDTWNGITVTGSTFSDNTSSGGGGALRAADGIMTITDSTFSGNRTTGGNSGGAVFKARRGDVIITRTMFEDNQTEFSGKGGGLYLEQPDDVSIVDSTFLNNLGREGGGMFHNDGFGPLNISGTRFEGNVAVDGGGGLWMQNTRAPGVISSSTFVRNEARETGSNRDGGGAIYWRSGERLTVNNSYFGGNTATGSGAAIRADYNETNLTLNFTTVFGNTSDEGTGDVHSDGVAQVFNGSALSSSGIVCQLDESGAVTSLYTVTSDSSCGLAGDTGSVQNVTDFGLSAEASSVVDGVIQTYRSPLPGSILRTGAPLSSLFPGIDGDQLSVSARSTVYRLTIGSIQRGGAGPTPEPPAPDPDAEPAPTPLPTSIPAGEGPMPVVPVAFAVLMAVWSGAVIAQRGRRGASTAV